MAFECTIHCIQSKLANNLILFLFFLIYFVSLTRAIKPRLRIYVSFDGNSYHAVYLHENSVFELTQKLCKLPGFFEYTANNGNGDSNGFPEWSKYHIFTHSKIPLLNRFLFLFSSQVYNQNILAAVQTSTMHRKLSFT